MKGRKKARKIVGGEKFLITEEVEEEGKKEKKPKTSDTKAILLPPPMRLVPSQFLSKIWLTPLSPLLFPFIAELDFMCHGIFLWLVWIICLVVSIHNLFLGWLE